MAITSYKTFLMHSTDGTAYTKLVDIKEFPDLGKAPDTIDITTLSDSMKRYLRQVRVRRRVGRMAQGRGRLRRRRDGHRHRPVFHHHPG